MSCVVLTDLDAPGFPDLGQICSKELSWFPYNHTPGLALLILVILVFLGNAALYFI